MFRKNDWVIQILSPANCPHVHSLSLVLLCCANGMDLKIPNMTNKVVNFFIYKGT